MSSNHTFRPWIVVLGISSAVTDRKAISHPREAKNNAHKINGD